MSTAHVYDGRSMIPDNFTGNTPRGRNRPRFYLKEKPIKRPVVSRLEEPRRIFAQEVNPETMHTTTVNGELFVVAEIQMVEQTVTEEWVAFDIPGDKFSQPHLKVTDQIKAEYPDHYMAFKRDGKSVFEGTPLAAIGITDPRQAHNFHAVGIVDVEGLAAVSDGLLPNLGPGARLLQKQAQAYLADQRVQSELSKTSALEAQLATQAEQIAQLMAIVTGGAGNPQGASEPVRRPKQ